MTVVDPMVRPLILALRDCLAQEIAKVPDPPAKVQVRAGDRVAMLIALSEDECCGGLAWVLAGSVYPSATFPQPDQVPDCDGPVQWAVTLELGAARCAPVGDEVNLPTEDDWLTVALAVLDDEAAIRRALCCFRTSAAATDRLIIVSQSQPLPVEGGCVGTLRTVTVAAPACDCRDAGPED